MFGGILGPRVIFATCCKDFAFSFFQRSRANSFILKVEISHFYEGSLQDSLLICFLCFPLEGKGFQTFQHPGEWGKGVFVR